jgi:hypothetical protein
MLPLKEEALDALVMRAQGADAEALQELVELFRPRTSQLVGTLIDRAERGPEIVQEVFQRIYGAAQRHELGKNFSLWLYLLILDAVNADVFEFVGAHSPFLGLREQKSNYPPPLGSLDSGLNPVNGLFI